MWSRERIAVAAYFAVLGFVCSTWASSIDDLKVLLALNEDQLGWLLFAGPVGNLVTFTFVSSLVAKLGARRSVILSASAYIAIAFALSMCFAFKAPIPCWCVVIAAFGGAGNILNITTNAKAGLVEKHAGRSIMSSFHGVFSVTCFGGGLLALFAAGCGVSVWARFLAVFALVMSLHLVALRALPADEPADCKAPGSSGWHRPDRALFAIGLAALVIMGCEGSVFDWVGVFYREGILAPPSRVKWGYCAVAAMMAAGRFVSDRLVMRFTARRVLHVDCVLVSLGLAIALSSPYAHLSGLSLHLVATLGYGIAGYGISALVPILYSKANRTKSMPPASAITFVGTMGFLGYFAGPPLIGHLAKWFNLSIALGLFGVLILFCLLLDPDKD